MRDISLVLATVGRTVELNRLFDSLLTQTWHNFEVIVVDQNRDDRLHPVLHRARSLGLSLRHLRHYPPNLALARNVGISAASGRWLGFPDDDCWYAPDTLECVMLRSRCRDRPHGIVVHWEEQHPPSAPGLLSWQRSSCFRDFPVASITLFLQRELAGRIGGFDGRLGVGQWFGAAEETDIVLRALREAAVIAYEPAARVHHRVELTTSASSTTSRRSVRQRARGTGALYAKHRLPAWVILRGLLAPPVRALTKPTMRNVLHALAHAAAVTRGRLDGWLRWRILHTQSDAPPLSLNTRTSDDELSQHANAHIP